ncbi:uncharacterized protein CANTADRAFT_7090 [Suhomyces tanzawaensis NRRL Y-17324]|uniref:PhoD-like phosphatase domain-containing protein n=1 Tax=Suhomyces tanzawaensis NRRL Y-17324 TaxID=984487 RepID=A0A1E4SGW8_9ASCO|nr:uncharacterized protein CANTADRAFT_7090 [Suhomyces tanzawaensis NRRL Y-17324]ODV78748.1 hypothetical protein CANTADRAFT_7090 [Suhomyces tanzawaensis NRRL Y-17324]
MSWYDPLPLDEYRQLNEHTGENPPKELPVDEPFAGLDIRCGPILRLVGTLEQGADYRGSILLAVNQAQTAPEITYQIGRAAPDAAGAAGTDAGATSKGTFAGTKFFEQDGISFFRYTVHLELAAYEQKVHYHINNATKQGFQFFVPGADQSMNVMSYSCNGFSLGADPGEFKSSLWLDVINKHDTNHYHVMLGGGDQIYADAVKQASPALKKWADESDYMHKRLVQASPELVEELKHFYLHHYLAWFGKGFWKGTNGTTLQALFPVAMAQIPSINIWDDHDIIDGFGSYRDATMQSEVFKAIGNVAYTYYMVFQHHQAPDEDIHAQDPSWILSRTNGPTIAQKNHSNYVRLGKEIAMVGMDCRTERKLKQIITPSTYSAIFDRLRSEILADKSIKHLLVMLGVPIFYPRLVWLEWLLTSTALKPLRHLATKGVIQKGLVNEFDGDVEVLDDLNDHWCSKHHKRERNKLIKDLIEFGNEHTVRITILSGDVHLGCLGRLKSKYHKHPTTHQLLKGTKTESANFNVTEMPERDPRLIFNVISSAIINGPPPDAMATLLNKRSKIHHFDSETDEDLVPLFYTEPDGSSRDNHRLLNKRNWSDLILAKQSVYKDTIAKDASFETVERRFPQPVGGKEQKHEVDSVHVKYPLYDDSLVTTIRVEKDPLNYDAESQGYEVIIPRLDTSLKLKETKIKHLN